MKNNYIVLFRDADAKENKRVGDPSPEAIGFAKRMIALKWTKETNVDTIASCWQAGYVHAQIDLKKTQPAQPSSGNWLEEFKDAYYHDNTGEKKEVDAGWKVAERHANMVYKFIVKHVSASSGNEGKIRQDNRLWVKIGKNIIQEIDRNILGKDVFDIETEYFMLQITNDNGVFKVTNAVDGWGINQKSKFENEVVVFLTIESKYFVGTIPCSQPASHTPEQENDILKAGQELAQATSNLIQDIKGKPNDTRYTTHTKKALEAAKKISDADLLEGLIEICQEHGADGYVDLAERIYKTVVAGWQASKQGEAGRWVKFSESEPLNSKIWRVRYSEHGTHSIKPDNYELKGDAVELMSSGERYLKTNLEWYCESTTPSKHRGDEGVIKRIEQICLKDAVSVEQMMKDFKSVYEICQEALSFALAKQEESGIILTKKDAENWLTDELEGEQSGTFSFYEVVELLHDYFVEANKAIAIETERLSSTPSKLSGDEKGMSGEQIWKLACNQILADMAYMFSNPDNMAKVERWQDKAVYKALAETIQNFPIPKFPFRESPDIPIENNSEVKEEEIIELNRLVDESHAAFVLSEQEGERLKGVIQNLWWEDNAVNVTFSRPQREIQFKQFKSENNL